MHKPVFLLALLSAMLHAAPLCPKPATSPAKKDTQQVKTQRTFAMIKPDAVQKGLTGDIIKLIERNGFNIVRMEKRTLPKKLVEIFYAEHKKRPFYKDLLDYITSGPVVTLELEKHNAVKDWRALLGATDPAQAGMGTIRKMFAESKTKNAAHGSDSPVSAYQELLIMFG